MSELHFEWDKFKATANARKHGVTFEESATVFRDELGRSSMDASHSIDEYRFVLIGSSEAGRISTARLAMR